MLSGHGARMESNVGYLVCSVSRNGGSREPWSTKRRVVVTVVTYIIGCRREWL